MERRKIEEYLANLKVPYSATGFEYLVDAIEMAVKKNGKIYMTGAYIEIGQKHFASPSAVERAIRSAIHRTGEKIKNKEFIVRAVYMLRWVDDGKVANNLWKWEDTDEYGKHYSCTHCGHKIMVCYKDKWTPEECPNCGAKAGE